MKLFIASLVAVATHAVDVKAVPESIDSSTDSLSTVTIDFGTNYGSWEVVLYGGTESSVEGFYLKITESGITLSTGDNDFEPAVDDNPQFGATFSLIMMFNDEEIDKDGSEEYWTIQYEAEAANPVT